MRYELTDDEWAAIKPMLPNKPRGVPRVNDRRVLNGIFWVLRSGAPWRDLPGNFGPYTTCYNRFAGARYIGAHFSQCHYVRRVQPTTDDPPSRPSASVLRRRFSLLAPSLPRSGGEDDPPTIPTAPRSISHGSQCERIRTSRRDGSERPKVIPSDIRDSISQPCSARSGNSSSRPRGAPFETRASSLSELSGATRFGG